MLVALVHTAVAKALGWALVHSLWEGALVAALVGIGLLFCRPASAKTRYGLACMGMLAMLAAFGVTLAILWPTPNAPMTLGTPPPLRAAPLTSAGIPIPPAQPPDRLPWIVPFWMAGVLIFYVRTAGSVLAAQRLRSRGTVAAPQEWQERLRKLGELLRLTRPVVLLESCLAETPVVMGFLRPAILIPAGLIAGLAPDQLEAILLHELAHIHRHDYLVNVMQSLVEGLLFYHPAVWWLSGLARAEREHCCDDRVVAVRGDARAYAAALAALEEKRPADEPALAASGGNLMKRIRRLVEPEQPRPVAGPVLAAVLLLAPIAVGLSAWQAPAPPAKSVAQTTDVAPAQPVITQEKRDAFKRLQTDEERKEFVEQFWLRRQEGGQFTLLAQEAPPQTPRPLTEQEKQRNAEKLKRELETPYRKWVTEDVAYIITAEERAAFERLQTDAEREKFIEQFWLRRDPTPGTPENEFKEEHYRRIAYANEHFASSIPGWKNDRGRIYIMYGPPDEIDDHSSGGTYQRPPEQGGGSTSTYPFQQWRYRYIEGIGTNVIIEFVDPTISGEFHMTTDPSEKDALLFLNASTTTFTSQSGLAFQVEVGALAPSGDSARVAISVPLKPGAHTVDVYGRITTLTGRRVNVFEDTVTSHGEGRPYRKLIPLAPGRYRADVVIADAETGVKESGDLEFEVK